MVSEEEIKGQSTAMYDENDQEDEEIIADTNDEEDQIAKSEPQFRNW